MLVKLCLISSFRASAKSTTAWPTSPPTYQIFNTGKTDSPQHATLAAAQTAVIATPLQAEVQDEGLCRVGWSTLAASYDIGTDRHSFGYGGTGKKSHARQFESYGEQYKQGGVIGCLFDGDQGNLTFSKNGEVFPVAFELPLYLKGQVMHCGSVSIQVIIYV